MTGIHVAPAGSGFCTSHHKFLVFIKLNMQLLSLSARHIHWFMNKVDYKRAMYQEELYTFGNLPVVYFTEDV
jgi:hypothetical protein